MPFKKLSKSINRKLRRKSGGAEPRYVPKCWEYGIIDNECCCKYNYGNNRYNCTRSLKKCRDKVVNWERGLKGNSGHRRSHSLKSPPRRNTRRPRRSRSRRPSSSSKTNPSRRR